MTQVGWAEIIKRNQLRQNGDLAGLDFVVNRTAYSVISRFIQALNPVVVTSLQAGWHIQLAYLSYLQTGQYAVFLLPLKEVKQIDRFEY